MRSLLISIFLTVSCFCYALEFVSEPTVNTYEFEGYLYVVETDAPEEDTITFKCIKKPDWLFFGQDDYTHNIAAIWGTAVYNLEDGGDTVIIEASNKDTTIFQEFVIWVDYPYLKPDIHFRPSTEIVFDQFYDDTLIVGIVWIPDSLTFEIICKPEWMNIQDFPGSNSISKGYRFFGWPAGVMVGDTFLVWIHFHYGALEFSYYEYFAVHAENFLWPDQTSPSVAVYPNPASDAIFIRGIREADIRMCRVYSMDGRMEDMSFYGNKLVINHLPAGIFILQLQTTSGEIFTLKFEKHENK